MEQARCQKYYKRDLFSLLPAVLMMLVIFFFALQPGEESLKSSEAVGMTIYSFFGQEVALSPEQMEMLQDVIRILAHIGEYAMLSLCVGFACTRNGIRRQLRAVYMCGSCLAVSLMDEFMQIFVPARYGDPLDVLADMTGVVLFSALILKLRPARPLPREKEAEGVRRAFLNARIDDVAFDEAVDRIMDYAGEKEQEQCRLLVTPNADHIIKLEKDKEFAALYETADLITTDGTPLMWIAESLGCPIREKVTGSDLLPAVCRRAAEEGRSLFFFATSEELIEKAEEKLKESLPELKLAGGYAPPMGFEKDEKEVERAVSAINAADADILVIGLGSPKSEKFIARNRARLKTRIALPIGAAIGFVAGDMKRAPLWMRKAGLEWFFRFLQEPGRLFRRYFIEDMKIFLLALKYRRRTIGGYLGEKTDEDRS